MRAKGQALWSGLYFILANGERQKQRRLYLARVLWIVVALVSTTFFLASLPPSYNSLIAFTAQTQHAPQALRVGLGQLGIPVNVYASFAILVAVLIFVSFTAISLVIFWQRQHDYTAWL